MSQLKISVYNSENILLEENHGKDETVLVYPPEYNPGDYILIESDRPDCFLWLRLDDSLPDTYVFLKGSTGKFAVPTGEGKNVFSPRAFSGEQHYLSARYALPEEIQNKKNLALNPYSSGISGLYPQASANIETRGEMIFSARNVIDGIKANHGHGEWPYTSWGINRDPRAALKIDFGRAVLAEEVILYIRADFPHDAWWEKATLRFSDGTSVVCDLHKTDGGQSFRFPPRQTDWIMIDNLIKADDPSPFPALSQFEVWGIDIVSGKVRFKLLRE